MSNVKRGRGRGGVFRPSSTRGAGLVEGHIDVPEDLMGLVIGKGGSTIQRISTDTGARIDTKRGVNRVFIKAETEGKVERAKQEILRIVSRERRRSTVRERRTFAIDSGRHRSDDHLCLKRMHVPGRDGRFFRLVRELTEGEGSERGMESDSIADMMRTAKEVMIKLRQDADKRPERSPLDIDVWVHLGHVLVKNVDDREAAVSLPISAVLSKTNKDRPSWPRIFEGGVVGLDIDWLHQLLADSADSDQCRTSVRHDIGFYTPSGQNRRFKVWIADGGPKDTPVQQPIDSEVLTGNEGSRGVGCTVVKAGPGILCTALAPRLIADVALPCHPFDCRLLVKTGVRDASLRRVDEEREDEILTQAFCEKVEIKDTDIILPPQGGLPDGYKLHYKRKCERRSYSFNGFELTTSRETFMQCDVVDRPEEQCKVDVHIHSMECNALLDQNGGRDWKPQDIVQLFPKMVQFVKEDLKLLEQQPA